MPLFDRFRSSPDHDTTSQKSPPPPYNHRSRRSTKLWTLGDFPIAESNQKGHTTYDHSRVDLSISSSIPSILTSFAFHSAPAFWQTNGIMFVAVLSPTSTTSHQRSSFMPFRRGPKLSIPCRLLRSSCGGHTAEQRCMDGNHGITRLQYYPIELQRLRTRSFPWSVSQSSSDFYELRLLRFLRTTDSAVVGHGQHHLILPYLVGAGKDHTAPKGNSPRGVE